MKVLKSDTEKGLTCPTVPNSLAHYTTLIQPEPKIIDCNSHTEVRHELKAHALLRVVKSEDDVPTFTEYHCSLDSTVEKWETYKVICYAQPKSKEVVIDVMDYCHRVAVMKQMPLFS